MRAPFRFAPAPYALATLLAAGGCFPTLQTARIDPGFRIDVGVTHLADQRRNAVSQGPDHIAYAAPVYGFGRRVEIGLPAGLYLEEGIGKSGDLDGDKTAFILWPYIKFGVFEPESRNRLALIFQGAWIGFANVGLRYGRDLGSWEPHLGVTYVFSGGPAGDDPAVTRYQEARQTMFAFSAGAAWNVRGRPVLEIGVLRNSYDEGAVFGDFGQETVRRTLYDLFVGFRASAFR
jgi:hypothetical protein